jgi:hypothetical protein
MYMVQQFEYIEEGQIRYFSYRTSLIHYTI